MHGHQQMSFFNAHQDERCFAPIHIYDADTGHCVTTVLRPGKTPRRQGGQGTCAPVGAADGLAFNAASTKSALRPNPGG